MNYPSSTNMNRGSYANAVRQQSRN
jgi:hypothetical protein